MRFSKRRFETLMRVISIAKTETQNAKFQGLVEPTRFELATAAVSRRCSAI